MHIPVRDVTGSLCEPADAEAQRVQADGSIEKVAHPEAGTGAGSSAGSESVAAKSSRPGAAAACRDGVEARSGVCGLHDRRLVSGMELH